MPRSFIALFGIEPRSRVIDCQHPFSTLTAILQPHPTTATSVAQGINGLLDAIDKESLRNKGFCPFALGMTCVD